ncbi:MAG: c-type cytochrome, partial [Opitutaceae bacterium]|nr:c-type cytochrome [Verrucomicrobiales bacterium]
SDEMFRPVALRLGPDGCLYIVDWYNKIISHNEVPRNHPERDKKRGRVWRVKHKDVNPLAVPDFMTLSGDELTARLGGENTTQSHLAWQAIGDRQMKELEPKLKKMIGDKSQSAGRRIAALWALEGLKLADETTVRSLFDDPNRNVRREAVRVTGELGVAPGKVFYGSRTLNDPDPEVRAEVIRATGRFLSSAPSPAKDLEARNAVRVLINGADLAPLDEPMMKSTQSGRPIKVGEAYEREFHRYLVRLFLEKQPALVAEFLQFDAQGRPVENTILATLALEPRTSATQIAKVMPLLKRPPGQEELLRLAQFPDEPGVAEVLKRILQDPATGTASIESLLKVRTRLDAAKITPLLIDSAKQLLVQNSPAAIELGIKLASAFQLAAVEPDLVRALEQGWGGYPKLEAKEYLLRPESLAALQALRELKSDRVDLFAKLAEKGGPAEQLAAVGALAASRSVMGPQQLASLYPNLSMAPRRTALAALTGTKNGAGALVKAVRAGSIPKDELDGATIEKLQAVLGNDADLAALMNEMASFLRPALRLDGSDNAWADTDITLDGPFTVETWVKLDPGIDNNDGILGAPGVIDMNFFGGLFRVWAGGGVNDVIVAKKKITAEVWTHVAVTRNGVGQFRIYQNGELDTDQGKPIATKLEHLRIGWTAPTKGTAGWLSEFRLWNRVRSADEIRADFDRSFEGEPRPDGLVQLFAGTNWIGLKAGARIERTSDFPPLLSPVEARMLAEKFKKFHALASRSGDAPKGGSLFTNLCMSCHSVGGQGGQVGPALSGAGASGNEALLRNILTPNAAMEGGYRAFRVELNDGDVLDGILVLRDAEAIVLRRPNSEDIRIPVKGVRRAEFTRRSIMPEGLLDGLGEKDVADLFAYLGTLK